MKNLFVALLLLFSSAAFGQQLDWTDAVNVQNTVINPTMNDCPSNMNAPTCGAWKESVGFAPGDWTNQFGSTEYVFSFSQNKMYQDIDLSQYETNLFNFTFSFSLNNSCRNSIGGYCENVDGPIDFISAKIYFYDTNGLNNEFTFLNGNVSTARIECNGLDIFGICFLGYSAYDNWQQFGWYSHVQSDTLFTSARIEFEGRDAGFWGGLYGPRIDNPMLTINYMPPPYPTSGGGAGMNVSAPGSDYIFIYKGNDPILFSQLSILGQDVVGWTAICEACGTSMQITAVSKPDPDYLFLYTDSIPTSGSYYSFQEQPPTVNCVTDPFDPSCVLTTLNIDDGVVDYSDPEEVAELLADEEVTVDTGSDDGSDDGSEYLEEELLADEDITEEGLLDEEELLVDEETSEEQLEELEELLADVEEESEASAESAVTLVATYRELSDEEKAAILADSISKTTLESALSVASDATSASSATASASAEVSSSSSSSRSTSESSSSSTSTTETTLVAEVVIEQKEEVSSSAGDASLDILETGRQLGQQALSETMAATESSANDSMKEAEAVAAFSSETSSNQSTVVASTETQSTDTSSQVISEQQTTETQVAVVTSEETAQQEIIVADSSIETVIDMGMSNDNNVTDSTSQIVEEANMLAESLLRGPVVDSVETEEALAIVEASRATSEQKTFDDESNKDAEVTTAMVDPALAVANTFNQAPSMMSLEFLGIVKPVEEKSDAEIRAEQVVAANKEEQDKINSNYMDADQSGIVAAIAVDADVTSYLSARLADNNTWYKPEDIYKGVVIKDNARGSYFLEKGNTDTYKKMVEEQYK